jgi:uncharacterized protein (DUF1330 family)
MDRRHAPEARCTLPGSAVSGTLPPGSALILVVLLTLRRDEREAFQAFERAAAAVMARHGGAIERTVAAIDGPEGTDGPALEREVHLVRFPDAAAYAAYRSDPALQALAPLRERAIVATEILVGTDGPDYAAP